MFVMGVDATILHADLDSSCASVEHRDDSEIWRRSVASVVPDTSLALIEELGGSLRAAS